MNNKKQKIRAPTKKYLCRQMSDHNSLEIVKRAHMQEKNDKTRLKDDQYTYTEKKDRCHIWSDKETTEIIDSINTPIWSLIISNQTL